MELAPAIMAFSMFITLSSSTTACRWLSGSAHQAARGERQRRNRVVSVSLFIVGTLAAPGGAVVQDQVMGSYPSAAGAARFPRSSDVLQARRDPARPAAPHHLRLCLDSFRITRCLR